VPRAPEPPEPIERLDRDDDGPVTGPADEIEK